METIYSTKLVALLAIILCVVVTISLEMIYRQRFRIINVKIKKPDQPLDIDDHETTIRALLKSDRVKNDIQYEEIRQNLLDKLNRRVINDLPTYTRNRYISSETKDKRKPKLSKVDNLYEEIVMRDSLSGPDTADDPDLIDGSVKYRFNKIKEKNDELRRKALACLPKFICEVHGQNPEEATTELEREWLSTYQGGSGTFIEAFRPSDTLHQFQVAAHMGQLFQGYEPSPCHQLYTNCPITFSQVKEFMGRTGQKNPLLM